MTDSKIPSGYFQLPENLVRELLRGHTSVLMENAERDQHIRAQISEKTCPQCNGNLTPSTSTDPSKIFFGANIRFVGQCARCNYRETVGP